MSLKEEEHLEFRRARLRCTAKVQCSNGNSTEGRGSGISFGLWSPMPGSYEIFVANEICLCGSVSIVRVR